MINRLLPNPSIHSLAHRLAIITIVTSIAQGLLAQSGALWLLFSPLRTLFGFELWRPFTSLFVAVSPLEVIFGALIIYSIGGLLERRWSRKRFLAVTLGIPLIAEVVVLALTLLSPDTFSSTYYPGSRQVVTTLWIVFGLLAQFSGETLNFWGTPITGKTFALIGVGFVVLGAVFGGVTPVIPELVTALLCYAYMYRHRAARWRNQLELRYYDWKLKRLKARSNLRVIKGSGSSKAVESEHDDDSEPGPQIH
jgi:membrane associated rhomboid family serine protease